MHNAKKAKGIDRSALRDFYPLSILEMEYFRHAILLLGKLKGLAKYVFLS